MKKNAAIFYHHITYRPIAFIFPIIIFALTAFLSLLKLPENIILISLGTLFLVCLIIIGMFESTININYFLNIHLDRKAYLIGDFTNAFVFSILSTTLFYLIIILLHYFKIATHTISINLYILYGLVLLISNRIFYILGFIFKKLSLVLLLVLLLLFIKYKPIELIVKIINIEKINLFILISTLFLVFSQIIIISLISKVNIFKKSLSNR